MSGSLRFPPLKVFWKDGLLKKALVPPPEPPWNPKRRGGTTGGLGVTSAMRVRLLPQPVWNFMVLSLLINRLVPPTAVANGELAGLDTVAEGSTVEKSPLSPVLKLAETPKAAASSFMLFSTPSSAAGVWSSKPP